MKIIINIKLTIMYISTQPDNTFHKWLFVTHTHTYTHTLLQTNKVIGVDVVLHEEEKCLEFVFEGKE